MKTALATGLAGALILSSLVAATSEATAKQKHKSERAMSPDSAKSGSSPDPKSERAMSPDSSNPGSAPNGHSERAMAPETK